MSILISFFEYIQGVLWVVDINVGDYFLVLYNQKFPIDRLYGVGAHFTGER